MGDYYSKATQSIFIVAGILMVFTFPYFFKEFDPTALGILAVMVLLAILAGMAQTGGEIAKKLNVLIAVVAFVLSAFRAMSIFFNGVQEPLMIFSFWILQILSLLFFLAIYFSIRASRV